MTHQTTRSSIANSVVRLVAALVLFVALLAFGFSLSGCGRSWQATVVRPDGSAFRVDASLIDRLAESSGEDQKGAVAADFVLSAAGHTAVERLTVIAPDGSETAFDWPAVADGAQWLADGRLSIGGETLPVARVEVEPPALLAQADVSLTDIAPTAAAALGLRAPAQSSGRPQAVDPAPHVLLIYLDGLGYQRYQEALGQGLVPNLAGLAEAGPKVGLTFFPPATNVATAVMLTGAPPEVTGVTGRGIRSTEVETLFEVATAAGRQVVAVEGDALAFNLAGADIRLSGDRDGNDSTDDNVLANAHAVLDEGLPDLLWVHFHGIDDAGHTYGPGSPEEAAALRGVDTAVGQILDRLPAGTLALLFSDHGMHVVDEEGREGNHGHLTETDMMVPVWVVVK